jgi:hypothetical protein
MYETNMNTKNEQVFIFSDYLRKRKEKEVNTTAAKCKGAPPSM